MDSVLLEDRAVGLEDDQAGNAADLEFLGDGRQACVTLGQGKPGHLAVVLVVFLLGFVAGQENDLDDLLCLVELFVEFRKDRGELAAGRAVVHTEIDAYQFGTLEGLHWVHLAGLGKYRGRSEKFLNHILESCVFRF